MRPWYRKKRWWIVAVIVLIVGVSLAGGGDDTVATDDVAATEGRAGSQESAADPETRLAQAMCADLRDGLSLFQLYSTAVDHYNETRDVSDDADRLAAAELVDHATSEHCSEFRDEWTATLPYEQWIATAE